jgi:hypothetical protein
VSLLCGCNAMPEAPPSIADTDSTLQTPMRPPSETKRTWWDFENILDSRSRKIERNLGY